MPVCLPLCFDDRNKSLPFNPFDPSPTVSTELPKIRMIPCRSFTMELPLLKALTIGMIGEGDLGLDGIARMLLHEADVGALDVPDEIGVDAQAVLLKQVVKSGSRGRP